MSQCAQKKYYESDMAIAKQQQDPSLDQGSALSQATNFLHNTTPKTGKAN
jgi:hypothetical protein